MKLDKLIADGYMFAMVIESIREFNRTVPFKPYEIRMASGERYSVAHADFVFVSPKERTSLPLERVVDRERLAAQRPAPAQDRKTLLTLVAHRFGAVRPNADGIPLKRLSFSHFAAVRAAPAHNTSESGEMIEISRVS